ncbi:MAG: DUF4337 domain-containing protein [Alphaproteobacteria bacterium]|nr:DUF4337 domain-containing protein [Alphaproteobacteria bacterium]
MTLLDSEERMPEALELEFNERNKRIGILIAILAGILAFTEAAGNNASSDALRGTIEASNTWAFFQAKTIRMTTLRTQADALELTSTQMPAGARQDAVKKQIADWRATAERYDSEPATGEGRKELSAKAKEIEAARDEAAAANSTYDLASGALQLGILLASAAVVTSVLWLAYIGAGLGVVGALFGAFGIWAPHLLGG